MAPYTKQNVMRCIGFLEGFSVWVTKEEQKLAIAELYDSCVEELRKAMMEEDECKAIEEPLGKYNAGYSDVSFLFEPDSWGKLIKDLKGAANSVNPLCGYLNPEGKKCSECNLSLAEDCYNKAFLDIVTRIEMLRERSDD